MPIEFRCSACNKLLRTPDETAGKQAKCPECGALTQIPSAMPGQENPFSAGDAASTPPPSGGAAGGPASPFSSEIPRPEGAAGPSNPYQSPDVDQPLPGGGLYAANPDLAAYAQARVSGPAIALIVTGALGALAKVAGIVMNVAQVGQLGMQGLPGQGPNPAFLMMAGGAGVVMNLVGLALAVLVIVAAVKMNKLENYGLAMAGAIIAMIPCFSPCCLLGLPFGIWALVVLSDGRVQAAFSAVKAGG